jgi:hypothetical protein
MIHDWLDSFMGFYYWNRGQKVDADKEHRYVGPARIDFCGPKIESILLYISIIL